MFRNLQYIQELYISSISKKTLTLGELEFLYKKFHESILKQNSLYFQREIAKCQAQIATLVEQSASCVKGARAKLRIKQIYRNVINSVKSYLICLNKNTISTNFYSRLFPLILKQAWLMENRPHEQSFCNCARAHHQILANARERMSKYLQESPSP